jgi:phage tail-like protein
MKRSGLSAARFLHLDGFNGWLFADRAHEVEPEHVPGIVEDVRGLTLPRGTLPRTSVAPEVMALATAHGLAFDRMGRAYAVREDHRGFCLFAGCEAPPAPCFGLDDVGRIGGIAIDARDRLYVALPDRGEVRVLRLSPPAEIGRIPMRRPVAVALGPGGRVFVLDIGDPSAPPAGDPIDADVVRVSRPHGDAIVVADNGAIAIVEHQSSIVDLASDGVSFSAVELGRPALPALAFANDSAQSGLVLFVGDALSGRIVEWQITGQTASPIAWSIGIDAWTGLAFRAGALQALGRGCAIGPVSWDANGFYARSLSVVIGPLDSGVPGTEWHRVTGAIDPPPGAASGVAVEILADDDCDAYDPAIVGDDSRWEAQREMVAARPAYPAELAFLSARGRYAYLRLTLHGDGRHSPFLRWLRVEFPRNSYLRFLPAVYSEDPVSRDLSARLLSLFESANADLSRTIDDLRLLFEPLAGDPELLPWLAERLDVLLEPGWPVDKTRRVLANALSLYRQRGTRAAFLQMLTDHGASGAQVIEGIRQRATFVLGSGHLGCDSVLPGSCTPPRMQLDRGVRLGHGRLDSRPSMEADPFTEQRGDLTVLVPATVGANPDVLARVTRIAELEAPAGSAVTVVLVGLRFGLGAGGRLGLDAALGAIAPWQLASDDSGPPQFGPMLLVRDDGELGLGLGPRLGMDSTV